jgi:serine O-acetyltransferase
MQYLKLVEKYLLAHLKEKYAYFMSHESLDYCSRKMLKPYKDEKPTSKEEAEALLTRVFAEQQSEIRHLDYLETLRKCKQMERSNLRIHKADWLTFLDAFADAIRGTTLEPVDFQSFYSPLVQFLESEGNRELNSYQSAQSLLTKLPKLIEKVKSDINFAYEQDPAATSIDEVAWSYPGIFALTIHRFAHHLHASGYFILARLASEYANEKTSIDIHPGATLGCPIFIDHGQGVVIGATAVLGDGCKLYQNVTLGTKRFHFGEDGHIVRGEKRHPTLGDHVTVYAGATVLGGETVIADGVTIGSGALVTKSVKVSGALVVGTNEIKTEKR